LGDSLETIDLDLLEVRSRFAVPRIGFGRWVYPESQGEGPKNVGCGSLVQNSTASFL